MTSPQIYSGIIPQLVDKFASQLTLDTSSTSFKILEAAFYNSLHGGSLRGRRLSNWIHETSVAYVNEIQTLFSIANFCFLAFSTKKACDLAHKEYNFSLVTDTPWSSILAVSSLAVAQLLAKEVTALKLARERHTTDDQQIAISERASFPQRITTTIHTAQLVVNIALGYLGEDRFLTAVSLAATSYSYSKNSQLNWMTFTRYFDCTLYYSYPVRKIKATYHMLALSPKETNLIKRCPVCLDDDAEGMISFCASHSIHKICMTELVRQKTEQFNQVDQINKFSIKHLQNGFHTHTTFGYEISIDQKNLPACPECRSVPIQNTLEMSITDAIHGDLNSKLTIKRPSVDRQYLYENINAIYCTAGTTVAFLQTYPELVGTMYKIQEMMLVTDLICYAATMHYLSKQINAKHNPTNSKTFTIGVVASMAIVAFASWYILLYVQDLLKPGTDLNESARGINPLDEDIQTLDLSFSAPFRYTLTQTVLVNRMIGSIALTFFSKQRKTNILSTAMMIATLGELSSLNWIQVIQRLDQKLLFKAIGKESVRQTSLLGVKSSETTHYFVANSFPFPHLKPTLKSITRFSLDFFKKSRWENYWEIINTNGVETSRNLWYKITLQSAAIKETGYSLKSNFVGTTVKIVDILHGEAKSVLHH